MAEEAINSTRRGGISTWEIRFPPLRNISGRTQICTNDGIIFVVSNDAVLPSAYLTRRVFDQTPSHKFYSDDSSSAGIVRLENINSDSFELILKFCYFQTSREAFLMTDKERAEWANKFIDVPPTAMCTIANAAYQLQVESLIALTCQAISNELKGKSAEQIREVFDMKGSSSLQGSISPLLATVHKHDSDHHETHASLATPESPTISSYWPPSSSSPPPQANSPPPVPPAPVDKLVESKDQDDFRSEKKKNKKRKRKRKSSKTQANSSIKEPYASSAPSSLAHDVLRNNSPSMSLARAFAEELFEGLRKDTHKQYNDPKLSSDISRRKSLPNLPTQIVNNIDEVSESSPRKRPRYSTGCVQRLCSLTSDIIKIDSDDEEISVPVVPVAEVGSSSRDSVLIVQPDSSVDRKSDVVQNSDLKRSNEGVIVVSDGESDIVVSTRCSPEINKAMRVNGSEAHSLDVDNSPSKLKKVSSLDGSELETPQIHVNVADRSDGLGENSPKTKSTSPMPTENTTSATNDQVERSDRLKEMKDQLNQLKQRDSDLNRERNECQQQAALLQARIEGYMEGCRNVSPTIKKTSFL